MIKEKPWLGLIKCDNRETMVGMIKYDKRETVVGIDRI